jgi:hypothetical protein
VCRQITVGWGWTELIAPKIINATETNALMEAVLLANQNVPVALASGMDPVESTMVLKCHVLPRIPPWGGKNAPYCPTPPTAHFAPEMIIALRKLVH